MKNRLIALENLWLMNKRRLDKAAETWDAASLDITNWPPVNPSELTVPQRNSFNQRKRALKLYLTTNDSIDEILGKTGMSRAGLFRLKNRALTPDENGQPVGYLACIPNRRLKTYNREKKLGSGTAGLFQQFLANYPEQHKLLDSLALGKAKLNQAPIRGAHFKELWLKFRDSCHEYGINVHTDYPFCNVDGGREAVRVYVRSLRLTHFSIAARIEYGDGAGKLASARSSLAPAVELTPYRRVQLDAHPIDQILNVRMVDPQGNDQDLPLSRIWLLAMVDVASRAVLGYSLSLSHNYTANDVLNCIASSFEEWVPKEIPDNALLYHDGAGFPSGVIDACGMRIFDTLQMDNAWSHLSNRVQTRIIDAGAIEVITIRPGTPRGNGYVERFMRTFESLGFHQWPNTTGKGPKDPKRRNPEKEAARLNIQYSDLELAADVVIANYNAKGHTGLFGRSPLEYIQYRLDKGEDLVRYANASSLDGLSLFECDFKVVVKANLEQGHKPYVQFKNVRYTSPQIQRRLDLNGKPVIFRVNTRDIRHATLFDSSGECIGKVSAEARWLLNPHSIATRKAIFKLMRDRMLSSNTREPLSDYVDYLKSRAPLSRRARNDLINASRQLTEGNEGFTNSGLGTTSSVKRETSTYKNRYRVRLTKTVVS